MGAKAVRGIKHEEVPEIHEALESKSGRLACIREVLSCLPPTLVGLIHGYEYVVCVHVLDGNKSAHIRYDPQLNQWTRVNSGKIPRYNSTAAVLGGYLYEIGGESSKDAKVVDAVDSVDRYDPNVNSWTAMPPMRQKRHSACSVTCGGKLYVLGGVSGFSLLNSMERFDPASQEWVAMPAMALNRGPSIAAVEFDKCIYVLGGSALNKVEKFDIATGQWLEVAPMRRVRYGLSAVAVGSHIYALGGDDCNFSLADCERYDPATDEWSDIAPMAAARQNFAAVGLGSSLYCLGGYQNGKDCLAGVERYDTLSKQWSQLEDMPHATCRHTAVCL